MHWHWLSSVLQELAYLSAALSIKRGEGPDKAYKLLNEAVEIHFTALKVSSYQRNSKQSPKVSSDLK